MDVFFVDSKRLAKELINLAKKISAGSPFKNLTSGSPNPFFVQIENLADRCIEIRHKCGNSPVEKEIRNIYDFLGDYLRQVSENVKKREEKLDNLITEFKYNK